MSHNHLKRKILGIDLGTTYSCMACIDEHGKPVVLKNFEGESITPSVVFFEGNQITVGTAAKENAVLYPEQVVSFIKRSMGQPHAERDIEGIIRQPEEISSYILKKMVKDAEASLGESIQDVVITCPAYFGINEREATRVAGEIAGLNVLHIINEPTAAAIAFGMADTDEKRVVMVYDLGGGTFDITLIELTPQAIQVICTGGNHNLGGKNWDDRIITYLAQCFEDESGVTDILDSPEACQDLQLQAERLKKMLTQRDKAPANITHAGERVKVELSRERFETMTQDLMKQTMELTQQMLAVAKDKGYSDFDELLLVGGSTRMPMVTQHLKLAFPDKNPRIFDPDESVAKGAAIFGWKSLINDELQRRMSDAMGRTATEPEDYPVEILEQVAEQLAHETGFTLGAIKNHKQITNVSSKSFGIVAFNAQDQERVCHLVLRNDPVPTTVTQPFATRHVNQENINLQIMEDERHESEVEISDSKQIGNAVLELPPGLPKSSPIAITFMLNAEGRLEITAIEKSSGNQVKAEIQTASVIQAEEKAAAIERHKQAVF